MAKIVKTSANKQCNEICRTGVQDEENCRQVNPLFVEVILENILNQLKDTDKSVALKEYRLVCKLWEQQIIKKIRRETHIKLHRILTPYPEGFGWNAMGGETKFQYEVPYQQVASFENVEVALPNWVQDDKYVDEKFENWFKVMGHQVKSLIYSCSLETDQKKNCTTLEKILKEWCPNLERLSLKNTEQGCLKGLIFTSLFEDPKKEMICKKLTELNLNMSLQKFTWQKANNVSNIFTNPAKFNQSIYNHGLPDNNYRFAKISNRAGIKVTVATTLDTNTELPNLSKSIPENFFPEYLDGGILGQLMKHTNVKKLTLGGKIGSTNRKHLMAFFHYRQNNWRSSVQHLEINWKGKFVNFTKDLVLIGKLKFPIVTLKLRIGEQVFDAVGGDLTRFLASFSETLKHLDIVNIIKKTNSNKLVLPLLPMLRTFTINQINICELTAANLVKNAPNLETCYLTDTKYYSSENLDTFFEESSMPLNEQLKEFRLTGNEVHFSAVQASKVLDWFPKVKRLELTGIMDENNGIAGFLEKLENSEVTHLKMSWCKESESNLKANIADDTALIQKIGKLQKLVSLEMSFEHEILPIHGISFHVMPIAFRDGFGKLANLRFLKLANFGVYLSERSEVLKYIEHIPIVHLYHIDYISQASRRRKGEMLFKILDLLNAM